MSNPFNGSPFGGSGGGGSGEKGDTGASAYEIAVANGFVGTQAEWLESLKGEPGEGGSGGSGPYMPYVQLWSDGDSKTGEGADAFLWAAARQNLDVWVGARTFGIGGTNTGSGANNLTNTARIATITTAISAAVAAGNIIDVVLTIGTNDAILAGLTSETIIANIRKYHDAIRAAGARYLIIMSIDPRTGLDATTMSRILSTNRAYADYCRAVPDAFFCDPASWLLDPASSIYGPAGGSGGATNAVTHDGLHCGAYGGYRKSVAAEVLALTLYRKRPVELVHASSTFDATNALRGNVLGAEGRTVAMGGTNSITNNGSGSVTGTPPSWFSNGGEINGTMNVAYTEANCAALGTLLGGTFPCVNVALSGTPSANTEVTLARRYVGFPNPGAIRMRGRVLVALNNLTGVAALSVATQNTSPATRVCYGTAAPPSGVKPPDELPVLNGLHWLDVIYDFTGAGNSGIYLNVVALSGRPVSGSIDLIGFEWRRDDAVPQPAA